jgi:hypothetical protein
MEGVKMKKYFQTAAIAGVVAFAAGAASAGTVCSVSIANNVMPSSGCEVGSTNNDNPLPGQVNADVMFGYTDWVYLAKDNDLNGTDEGPFPASLTVSGGLQSGTWTINNPFFDDIFDYMIVLKGGVGNNTQPNYVGWLVTAQTGSYTTPFFNAMGGGAGNPKDISHLTLYARGTPQPSPVPVPAAALLLLTGAGALGGLRMKRKG